MRLTHDFIVLQDLAIVQQTPSDDLSPVKELKNQYNCNLSDTLHNRPIDVLLGSVVLGKVIQESSIHLTNGAIAIRTIFGYALQGPVTTRPCNPSSITTSCEV
jgi:hypothetical protein